MSRDLDARLRALADAVALADGRLDAHAVASARRVVERAGERIGLGLESTVVALAGPTGAGKSSLFNLLAGSDVSAVGRRRPTTSTAAASVWGDESPALLEWLGVPRRHRAAAGGELDGLVLVDLPDFDSVERSHRLEVDRLVELVDLLVWVVDPQKYADAALHDGYLRPLARHAQSMLVVLNQADVVDERDAAVVQADLAELLRSEGLDGVPVVTTSAVTGTGIDRLRAHLRDAVRRRAAALERLSADVCDAADALAREVDPDERGAVRLDDRKRLSRALADAAGVGAVERAVDAAHRRRGSLAVGWPFWRWVRRLRPDPLRRLRLPETPTEDVRTSLPPPTPVQREQVAAATRALAAGAGRGLPPPWPNLVRTAATRREDEVADRLDRAAGGADLHVSRPRWWTLAGFVQKLVAAATAVGVVWLLALVLLAWLQLDDVVPLPEVRGVPVPTVLLLAGVAVGIALAWLFRLVNGLSASRRARAAGRSLRARVDEVGDELVLRPVERELQAHAELVRLLRLARG